MAKKSILTILEPIASPVHSFRKEKPPLLVHTLDKQIGHHIGVRISSPPA